MGDREKMLALAVFAERKAKQAAMEGRAHKRVRQYGAVREMLGREHAFEAMHNNLRLALGLTPADYALEARMLGLRDTDDPTAEAQRVRMAIRGRYPVVVGGADTDAPGYVPADEARTEALRVLGDATKFSEAPEDEQDYLRAVAAAEAEGV